MRPFPHPVTSHGRRVPGWEDLNFALLAKRLHVTAEHCREALTGRENCSFGFLARVAKALDITKAELVERIEIAKRMDGERIEAEGRTDGHRGY